MTAKKLQKKKNDLLFPDICAPAQKTVFTLFARVETVYVEKSNWSRKISRFTQGSRKVHARVQNETACKNPANKS